MHGLRFKPGTAANRAVFKAQGHPDWTRAWPCALNTARFAAVPGSKRNPCWHWRRAELVDVLDLNGCHTKQISNRYDVHVHVSHRSSNSHWHRYDTAKTEELRLFCTSLSFAPTSQRNTVWRDKISDKHCIAIHWVSHKNLKSIFPLNKKDTCIICILRNCATAWYVQFPKSFVKNIFHFSLCLGC